MYQRLLHTFLALPKFIPTRYAATSVWFPASLLANLVCPLAFVHPIHSIEATKKHKEGRRMLTTWSALSQLTHLHIIRASSLRRRSAAKAL